MRTIACLSASDRSDLFRNTAARMGLSDAIVEKDFWVCFMLDYLFHRSPWKGSITFKGGTSLSKAYRLINRFSEDIDLILDWRVLDEFVETGLIYAIDHPEEIEQWAKEHPDDHPIRVVREYPVYKKETEAKARKRKLAEEKEEEK